MTTSCISNNAPGYESIHSWSFGIKRKTFLNKQNTSEPYKFLKLKNHKKLKIKSIENMKRIVCFQDVGEMVQPAEDSIVVISNGLSISGEMIGVGGTKVGFQIDVSDWKFETPTFI